MIATLDPRKIQSLLTALDLLVLSAPELTCASNDGKWIDDLDAVSELIRGDDDEQA